MRKSVMSEMIIYTVAGIGTTAVDWTVTFLMSVYFSPTVSNAVAVLVSVLFAYVINSRVVFRAEPDGIVQDIKMLLEFASGRLLSGAVQVAAIFVFVELMDFNHVIIKALTGIFVIIFNYVVSKFFVFKKGTVKNAYTLKSEE